MIKKKKVERGRNIATTKILAIGKVRENVDWVELGFKYVRIRSTWNRVRICPAAGGCAVEQPVEQETSGRQPLHTGQGGSNVPPLNVYLKDGLRDL